MDLTFRNAATLIELAVFHAINRALRRRLPAAADIIALRSMVTRGAGTGYARRDDDSVYVAAKGVCYEWSTASTAADDGDLVIAPTDAGVTGRWLKGPSKVQSGYLADVRLYEGEQSEDELLDRLLGQRPAVAIRWLGADHVPQSQVSGSLYKYKNDFELWVASSNYRGSALPEAVVGSAIAAEAARDPGVNAILGDLKKALAGKTGEELGQPGIAYAEIGREQPVYRSLSERLFVFSLALRVHATVQNQDDDLETLDRLMLQRQIGDLHAQNKFDPLNYVASGIDVPLGPGLATQVSAGTAKISGATVSYAGELRTFNALRWTYRDLKADATMVFIETPVGSVVPAVTGNALRVGRTDTDAGSVIADTYFASTLSDYGDPDEIDT